MKRYLAVVLMMTVLCISGMAAEEQIAAKATDKQFAPTATCEYAVRDTCTLLLDIYTPTPGSVTTFDGKTKPTVLFVFGGGFIEGRRDESHYMHWFRMLADEGYPIVSIDYRLGLKGVHGAGINRTFIKATRRAIDMAVDDLFSATSWLLEHGAEYGIDARNMVVSGSSAGAITVMQGAYELACRSERCASLPDDFNYAGVMSFAGAIYTFKGGPKYAGEPCPILLFHGVKDKIVPYSQISIGRIFFGGTKPLTKAYKKHGYNYNAYRYVNHGHEIANNMVLSFPEEIRFLETNVIRGQKRIIDTFVDDPDVPFPDWGLIQYKSIYK
jgi:dipeptidyl aminopeptidase/acylaminoacyl peptidase